MKLIKKWGRQLSGAIAMILLMAAFMCWQLFGEINVEHYIELQDYVDTGYVSSWYVRQALDDDKISKYELYVCLNFDNFIVKYRFL